MVFSLYINSPAVLELYRAPVYLLLPVFYWLSPHLLLTIAGEMHDDPVVFGRHRRRKPDLRALIMAIAVFQHLIRCAATSNSSRL